MLKSIRALNQHVAQKQISNTNVNTSFRSKIEVPANLARIPKRNWLQDNNLVAILHWIQDSLHVHKYEDVCKLSSSDVAKVVGPSFLKHFGMRWFYKAIDLCYPNEINFPWVESSVPNGWFGLKANRRKYFDYIAKKHNINQEDWYDYSYHEIKDLKFESILMYYYNHSLLQALIDLYPEFNWDLSRFAKYPRGYWKDINNQRKHFDNIAKHLNIKRLDDWYQIKKSDVMKFEGTTMILSYYRESLSLALINIYSEHDWLPWRFTYVPHNYWKHKTNQMTFIKWLQKKMNEESRDVTDLRASDLKRWKAGSLIRTIGSMYQVLRLIEPNGEISPWYNITMSKSQKYLESVIRSIFPKEEIFSNYMITNSSTTPFELDIYLPNLQLAFEYQGSYHYISNAMGKVEEQKKKDRQKLDICKQIGITLIEVPFWWDERRESLLSTIHRVKPDLIPSIRDTTTESGIPTRSFDHVISRLDLPPMEINQLNQI